MRIALLDPPNFTPPYDASLAAALARRGHEVDLLTAPRVHGEPVAPAGYRRHDVFLRLSSGLARRAPRARARLLAKGLEYVPSVRRAMRLLERLAPEVVHVQWLGIPHYDVRWLGALSSRGPLVVTAHEVPPKRWGPSPAWIDALRLADRVIVHSERALAHLVSLGLPRERIVSIAHPVFEASPNGRPTEPDGRTLLFFGFLRRYKGLDVLLRALPAVARAVPDARLVVAGHPLEPAEPLQELAAELGVGEQVEWRLEHVPDPEVPALFARAAAVVLPYREHDTSGVLALALGHGRPAVASDLGSLGAIVRRFSAGEVVPPEDPEALAEACVRLLSDPAALVAAARGAREAAASLTWDGAAEQHERVYRAILEERA